MQSDSLKTDARSAFLVSRPGVMRQALRIALSTHAEIEIVASFGDGLNALQYVMTHRPDLVIIDTNLLDEEVTALVCAVKQAQPGVLCLVLVQTGHRGTSARAAGADAVVPREEWEDGIAKVMRQTSESPAERDE